MASSRRKWIHGRRLTQISTSLGCPARQFLLTYLGAPLFKGRCKGIFFEELFNKFANRLTGWKAKFISFAGHITLIKSTLSSLPIHILSCLAISKQIIARMEGLIRTFLWSQNGQNRSHWVSWDKISTPTDTGGLGIRKLSETIYGLHGKLAWNIFPGESLLARLLYEKYGLLGIHGQHTFRPNYSSRLWKVLYLHFQNLQHMSCWRVGEGSIRFWQTNRIGEILDASSDSAWTLKHGMENLASIQHMLTDDQISRFTRLNWR